MRTVILAIGGNALVKEGEFGDLNTQMQRARQFAQIVADLVADKNRVVVVHGNGPQVGYILRRGEIASAASEEKIPDLPLWAAVAQSQGEMGHILGLSIEQAIRERKLPPIVFSMFSHTLVDLQDPAFQNPDKPIGGVIDPDLARKYVKEKDWKIITNKTGSCRRVVASPYPQAIIEAAQIKNLLSMMPVLITGGGGGIPVVKSAQGYTPVDAVVDKDRLAAILGSAIDAQVLVLVTAVDAVALNFGSPQQKDLDRLTAAQVKDLLEAGQFPPGSMGPKMEAALAFVSPRKAEEAGCNSTRLEKREAQEGSTSRTAIVTSIAKVSAALQGKAGTQIVWE